MGHVLFDPMWEERDEASPRSVRLDRPVAGRLRQVPGAHLRLEDARGGNLLFEPPPEHLLGC